FAAAIAQVKTVSGLAEQTAELGQGRVPVHGGGEMGQAGSLVQAGDAWSGCHAGTGQICSPRRVVSTSAPAAVTAIMCSHWADRRPSRVSTVQPSAFRRV